MKAPNLILVAVGLVLAACKPPENAAPEKKEPEKPSPVSHNDKGETVLKFDAEALKRLNLQLAPLVAASHSPEARAFGRVLDPAPLTALVSELATASLAFENAKRELELAHKRREADLAIARTTLKLAEETIRLTRTQGDAELAAAQAAVKATSQELERTKTLAKQNNASERALQTAEAAAAKDRAALAAAQATATRATQAAEAAAQSSRLQLEITDATTQRAVQQAETSAQSSQLAATATRAKLISAYSRGLAEFEKLPELAAGLNAGQAVLVRLDVPAGEPVKDTPTGAVLFTANGEEVLSTDLFGLGSATASDAQSQCQGFLALVKSKHEGLRVGGFLNGALQLPGDKETGVTVPRAAIVRHEGEAFIYVATKDGEFTKKEIELEHPTPDGWFVHEGLKPGDKIVVSGAQQLLSEESKGKD